jgi:hypothetical protein
MVDPPPLPVNPRLKGSEPWVAKDDFVFSQVREEESEGVSLGSHLCLKIHEISKLSTSIWGTINVE